MTLEELEHTLPNGLHDAEVSRLAIDYVDRKARVDLEVWVGDMDDPPERREAYRLGHIEMTGLIFLIVEPPEPTYPFQEAEVLTIDGCDMRQNVDAKLLASIPADGFFHSFYVGEWNSFVHVAARDARLIWEEDGEVKYRADRDHFAPGESIP